MKFRWFFFYWSTLLMLSAVSVSAQVLSKDPTLAQYIWAMDWLSMGVAALIALTGGAGRTAMSLFRADQTIANALRETIKDALVALFTGAVCFVLINAYASAFKAPSLPLQATFIFIAGFARGTLLNWVDATFGKLLDLGFELMSSWAKARVAAATAPAVEQRKIERPPVDTGEDELEGSK